MSDPPPAMEFYPKQTFDFDEDTTDTEDDSGIAEISSSVDYRNSNNDCLHDVVPLDADVIETATGQQQQQQQQPQSQDALGRFFSYWWAIRK